MRKVLSVAKTSTASASKMFLHVPVEKTGANTATEEATAVGSWLWRTNGAKQWVLLMGLCDELQPLVDA